MRVGGTVDAGRDLQSGGEPERCEVGDANEDEQEELPAVERQDEREHEPNRTPRSELRQPDERIVQRVPPVVDDPAFPVLIEPGQVGTICFAWSISCCRSNGFPTKACAPRVAASACACSSTLPLNITTGIAPTP